MNKFLVKSQQYFNKVIMQNKNCQKKYLNQQLQNSRPSTHSFHFYNWPVEQVAKLNTYSCYL